MPFCRRYHRFASIVAARGRLGSAHAAEIEARSYSIWNGVVTVLLVTTILYDIEASQRPNRNATSENYIHLRPGAFFIYIWAFQALILSFQLVWAVAQRRYHLCYSWVLCEILIQTFVSICVFYGIYHAYFDDTQRNSALSLGVTSSEAAASAALRNSNKGDYVSVNRANGYSNSYIFPFRPPRYFSFLIVLHFIVKGFGFWIVTRYMNFLENLSMTSPHNRADIEGNAGVSGDIYGNTIESLTSSGTGNSMRSMPPHPPPSYDDLCADDLPCYDEALKLCLKESPKENQFRLEEN